MPSSHILNGRIEINRHETTERDSIMPKSLQSYYSNITRTGDVRTITIFNPKILYPLALYCKYSPPCWVTLIWSCCKHGQHAASLRLDLIRLLLDGRRITCHQARCPQQTPLSVYTSSSPAKVRSPPEPRRALFHLQFNPWSSYTLLYSVLPLVFPFFSCSTPLLH